MIFFSPPQQKILYETLFTIIHGTIPKVPVIPIYIPVIVQNGVISNKLVRRLGEAQ